MLAIAQEQSISKAAAKLYVTQSALNQQLLKLEKELGTPLFERKNHTMVPTFAGRTYLEAGQKMVDLKESTYKIIHDITEETTGVISVAFTPERGATMFTEVFPLFQERYPNIQFNIREGRVKTMEQMVLQRQVSFAISTSAPGFNNPDLKYIDFLREDLVLMVPATHPLAYMAGPRNHETLPQIDIRLFKNDRFVLPSKETRLRQLVDRMLRANDLRLNSIFESSSTGTVVRMIRNQLCLGFVPRSYAKPDDSVVYFTTSPREYWMRCILMLPDTHITKAEQFFIDLVKLQSTGKLPQNREHLEKRYSAE